MRIMLLNYEQLLMKKSIYIISLLLFCLSCNDRQNGENINSIEDFPFQSLSSERLSTDFFLANPYQLEVVDSLLWIMDEVDGCLIAIYDLHKKQLVNRAVQKGQGPMEVLPPLSMDISINSNNLILFQRQNGIITSYSMNDLLQGLVQEINRVQFKQADRLIEIPKGYLTMGAYDDGMFKIWSENGEMLNAINDYPEYINQIDNPMRRYQLAQGYAAYSNKNNNVVFASYFTGDIAFYHLNDNDLKEFKRINIGRNRLKKRIQSTGDTNLTGEDIVHSYGINSTYDDFYILYSGEKMSNSQKSKNSFILRYNSTGDFVRCYKTDVPVIGFCVNQNNSKIYAVSLSEDLEYVIVEFKLD